MGRLPVGDLRHAGERGGRVIAVAVGFAVALAVWSYMFLTCGRDIWFRTWIGAAVLTAYALTALAVLGDLERAIGAVDPRSVVAGLTVGVGWLVATHVGYRVVARLVPSFVEQVHDVYAIATGGPSWRVAGAVVAMAIGEELLFRALFQHEGGFWLALVAYAAVQLVERKWVLVIAAVAGGAVWGGLYWWRASLVAPVLAHVIWTGALTLVWPLPGEGVGDTAGPPGRRTVRPARPAGLAERSP